MHTHLYLGGWIWMCVHALYWEDGCGYYICIWWVDIDICVYTFVFGWMDADMCVYMFVLGDGCLGG